MIATLCDEDMMVLEHVLSLLELFVDCVPVRKNSLAYRHRLTG
jgi:hypothetical protein